MAGGQKKAKQEGRTRVFVDEAGFYLLPGVVYTYAPRGQTPVLRVPLTRDHLSAISAITPQGKLFMRVQDTAFKGPAIVRFLRHLLGQSLANCSSSGMACPPITVRWSKIS